MNDNYVRYRIRQTMIDGQAIEPGTEVALKIYAMVGAREGQSDGVTRFSLVVTDWGGPWVEARDPGEDGPDALRDVKLCGRCRAGEGGECHTPGCALWMNRAPDVPVQGGAA